MKPWVFVDVELLDTILTVSGIKNGDTHAPLLFSIFAIITLQDFAHSDVSIYIRYHTTVKLSNVIRFTAVTETFMIPVHHLLYVDDIIS